MPMPSRRLTKRAMRLIPDLARSLEANILSTGGSQDPEVLVHGVPRALAGGRCLAERPRFGGGGLTGRQPCAERTGICASGWPKTPAGSGGNRRLATGPEHHLSRADAPPPTATTIVPVLVVSMMSWHPC